MRALRAWLAAASLPLCAWSLCACESESSAPLGSGDNTHVDVDASQGPPPMNDDDASPDSPFAPLDGPYTYGALPDGYAPLVNCEQCMCPSGTYCYGGTPSTAVSSCDQTAATGALQPGCHTLPAACASGTDCVCLLQALESTLGQTCYAACAVGTGAGGAGTDDAGDAGPPPLVVYCPG